MTVEQIRAELDAMQQPFRRGYRALPQNTWTGVVWSKEKSHSGEEVADCGHRHFISAAEAMQCPALDEYCPALAVDSLLAAHAPTYLAALLDVAEAAQLVAAHLALDYKCPLCGNNGGGHASEACPSLVLQTKLNAVIPQDHANG